ELLLTGRGPGLRTPQANLAGFEELTLPVPDRLLGHLRPPRSLRDGDLTSQDRQHDPDLLLSREHRRSRHDDQTPRWSGPQETGPARNLDARHDLHTVHSVGL